METFGLCLLTIGGLFRVKDQRNILVTPTDLAQQFQSSLGVAILNVRETAWGNMHRETGIGDHTERVLVILLVNLHRLLVVRGEHHFRTTALSLGCGMWIQCLGRETLRLREDIII